ncbi:MAG: metallophosphoesterase [Sphingomonas bacterium]|nr:metallophosphoesterase [Sphingomonas bacterium]
MIRRLLLLVVMLLGALAAAPPLIAQASPPRIVAVGDLHGDYSAWIDIARNARLVDATNKWIGGQTILVQTGDIVDRGADSLKIIRHLQQLDGEAKRAGGRVIVLLGNHEAMLVTGDFRYVTPGEYAAFADRQSKARRDAAFDANAKAIVDFYHQRDASLSPRAIRAEWITTNPLGKVEFVAAWSPSGELGRWAATLPAAAKVGDSLFVHGGISAKYSLVPLVEINRRARVAIQAGDASDEAIINDQMGPLWYRGLVSRAGDSPAAGRPTIDSELDGALRGQGVRRLVIGHTPEIKGIAIQRGGKLVQIDTGISRYYGGKLGWLEIIGDRLIPHSAKRSVK